jgi:hypothetical protein
MSCKKAGEKKGADNPLPRKTIMKRAARPGDTMSMKIGMYVNQMRFIRKIDQKSPPGQEG